ncbi:MAG: hypothetical protein U0401_30125 [Anaerolineae bacterium]
MKDAGLTSLEDDYEWSFTTVSPAAIGSLPAAGDTFVSPSPVISVTFNQKMNQRRSQPGRWSMMPRARPSLVPSPGPG